MSSRILGFLAKAKRILRLKIAGTPLNRENDNSRKRDWQDLLNSEEIFKIIFEHAPDAMYLNDLTGNFIYGNKKAEELIGLPYKDIIAPSEYKNTQNRIMNLLERKPSSLQERIFLKKDGTEFPVEINLSTIRDAEGKFRFNQREIEASGASRAAFKSLS